VICLTVKTNNNKFLINSIKCRKCSYNDSYKSAHGHKHTHTQFTNLKLDDINSHP